VEICSIMEYVCNYKVGDVIKVKNLNIMPEDWEDDHFKYMGQSYVVSRVEWDDIDERYEIHCDGVYEFFFLEDEIKDPVMFVKLSEGDFLL